MGREMQGYYSSVFSPGEDLISLNISSGADRHTIALLTAGASDGLFGDGVPIISCKCMLK